MIGTRSSGMSNNRKMSACVSFDTAITASAISIVVFSSQLEKSYPRPSCSRFQGRNGSRL